MLRILKVLILTVLALPLKVAMFFVNLFAIWITFGVGIGTQATVFRLCDGVLKTSNAFLLSLVFGYCAWHSACEFLEWLMTPRVRDRTALRRGGRTMDERR